MSRRREVLGIPVSDALLARWVDWYAPARQPFLVAADDRRWQVDDLELPLELRDTYELYGGSERLRLAWLSEGEFADLPSHSRTELVRTQVRAGRSTVPSVRRWGALVGSGARDQADGHRFVWWPSLLAPVADPVLTEFVDRGRRPSQHHSVPGSIWAAARTPLPRAEELAGTFPGGSGPNCFGAVMAAAGVPQAEQVWMQRHPFEAWLSEHTRPGGSDDDPGTVLVWRSSQKLVEHAAVTLGGGWALHKPSQGWMSPTKVLRVEEVMLSSRARGRRVSRRRLIVG